MGSTHRQAKSKNDVFIVTRRKAGCNEQECKNHHGGRRGGGGNPADRGARGAMCYGGFTDRDIHVDPERAMKMKDATRATCEEAAKELHMSVLTLRELMKRDRLPIGYAILGEGGKHYHYVIFRKLLDAYRKEVIG